ncbi:MAG: hypothetical protein ABIR28_06840 [Vicinamibacteria bacterium]
MPTTASHGLKSHHPTGRGMSAVEMCGIESLAEGRRSSSVVM